MVLGSGPPRRGGVGKDEMAKKAYGIFIQGPPPDEPHLFAIARSLKNAKKKAIEWGGYGTVWSSDTEGVAVYGDKMYIEEIKLPVKKEEPLSFPKWDEIFETGIFEKYLAPGLKFHLTKYGEVVSEERAEWEKVWKEVEYWLIDGLQVLDVDPYSLQGREIYPSDIEALIKVLEYQIPKGPREWAPGRHNWRSALRQALETLLEDNK